MKRVHSGSSGIMSLVLAHVLAASLGPGVKAATTPPEFDAITRALDEAGFRFTVAGGERAIIERPTERYTNFAGNNRIQIGLHSTDVDGQPWAVAIAFDLFSLAGCAHPDAAKQVLLEAADKLSVPCTLLCDASDGTVTARLAVPMAGGTIEPAAVASMVGAIVDTAEGTDPVLRRAMDSGRVDWPKDDRGPQEPTAWLDATGPDGSTIRVGWAPWPDRKAWASTLISADGLLRRVIGWNDEERDAFGRQLAAWSSDSTVRATFAEWLRGTQYLEGRYPPLAIRIWAPTGTEVSASATCSAFARSAATDRATVDAMGHVDLHPLPSWDVDALLALERPADAPVGFEVGCGGRSGNATAVLTVLPVGLTELGLPAVLSVATYVNEGHPWVRRIAAEAARLRIADAMGVTDATPRSDAVRQLYAVWRALRDRDVQYVSTPESAEGSDSQVMKLLHESLGGNGANCADGTAALAGVLRSLGFDVILARTRSHVLLAVQLQGNGQPTDTVFLETTALGDDVAPAGIELFEDVEAMLPENRRDTEWDSFKHACSLGSQIARDARTEGGLVMVNLKELRDAGLRPIPVGRSEAGNMPPPPPGGPIAKRRAEAVRKSRDEEAAVVAWLASLPEEQPSGYRHVEDIVRDLESVGRDYLALGRILRAIDGDGASARCMRATARLTDGFIGFRKALDERFPSDDPGLEHILPVPRVGARVQVQPAPGNRYLLHVFDAVDVQTMLLGVHTVDDALTIDGLFLERHFAEITEPNVRSIAVLQGQRLGDSTAIAELDRILCTEIAQGRLADRDAAQRRFATLLLDRFARTHPPEEPQK